MDSRYKFRNSRFINATDAKILRNMQAQDKRKTERSNAFFRNRVLSTPTPQNVELPAAPQPSTSQKVAEPRNTKKYSTKEITELSKLRYQKMLLYKEQKKKAKEITLKKRQPVFHTGLHQPDAPTFLGAKKDASGSLSKRTPFKSTANLARTSVNQSMRSLKFAVPTPLPNKASVSKTANTSAGVARSSKRAELAMAAQLEKENIRKDVIQNCPKSWKKLPIFSPEKTPISTYGGRKAKANLQGRPATPGPRSSFAPGNYKFLGVPGVKPIDFNVINERKMKKDSLKAKEYTPVKSLKRTTPEKQARENAINTPIVKSTKKCTPKRRKVIQNKEVTPIVKVIMIKTPTVEQHHDYENTLEMEQVHENKENMTPKKSQGRKNTENKIPKTAPVLGNKCNTPDRKTPENDTNSAGDLLRTKTPRKRQILGTRLNTPIHKGPMIETTKEQLDEETEIASALEKTPKIEQIQGHKLNTPSKANKSSKRKSHKKRKPLNKENTPVSITSKVTTPKQDDEVGHTPTNAGLKRKTPEKVSLNDDETTSSSRRKSLKQEFVQETKDESREEAASAKSQARVSFSTKTPKIDAENCRKRPLSSLRRRRMSKQATPLEKMFHSVLGTSPLSLTFSEEDDELSVNCADETFSDSDQKLVALLLPSTAADTEPSSPEPAPWASCIGEDDSPVKRTPPILENASASPKSILWKEKTKKANLSVSFVTAKESGGKIRYKGTPIPRRRSSRVSRTSFLPRLFDDEGNLIEEQSDSNSFKDLSHLNAETENKTPAGESVTETKITSGRRKRSSKPLTPRQNSTVQKDLQESPVCGVESPIERKKRSATKIGTPKSIIKKEKNKLNMSVNFATKGSGKKSSNKEYTTPRRSTRISRLSLLPGLYDKDSSPDLTAPKSVTDPSQDLISFDTPKSASRKKRTLRSSQLSTLPTFTKDDTDGCS